jgi:hypothetical protein
VPALGSQCPRTSQYHHRYPAGKQFLTVYNNLNDVGLSIQFGVLQSDAVTFFIIGGFTALASLMGLLFMNSKEVTSRNSIYFLTLASFCMQATAATLSSIDSTIIHEQLAPFADLTLRTPPPIQPPTFRSSKTS